MKIRYAPSVLEEIVDLSSYIAEDSLEAAERFLDACDETFRFLAANPYVGSERDFGNAELTFVRMWRVKNFEKYLVFYATVETGVKILHVIHSAIDYNRVFDND